MNEVIMNTRYIFHLILSLILISFPLEGNTPRLLIVLGEKCDFSPQQLASDVHALIVSGTEKSMREQIILHDTRDNTHLFVLNSPVSCLIAFASDLYYDYLFLNDDREHAYNELNAKIASLPATSDELPRLSSEERGEFYSLLMKVSEVLNHHHITFWGISGTLLGAVRHAGMVPWDDDIDIVILHKDQRKLRKITNSLKRAGLELYVYQDYFYKIFSENGNSVIDEDGNVWPWKYPFIDLFVVNNLDGHLCIVSHAYPQIDLYREQEGYRGWFLYPEELQLPQVFLPFGPLNLPVPHYAEAILDREYGVDWRTTAYLWHDHSCEKELKRIKVDLINCIPPTFVLP